MRRSAHPYLHQRQNAWRVVVEIPAHLQAVAGRARFVKSLGVITLPEAENRKHYHVAAFKRRIEELERGKPDPDALVVAKALEFREALMAADNMILMRGEYRESDAASELLGVVNEEAQALLEARGKSAGDLFHNLATGKVELIRDHYPVWLAQFKGTEKTKALHKATLERFLAWAGQHTSVQATKRRKAGEFVQYMLDEGLARKTIARHLSALSSLWRWLIGRGIAELEPRDNPWREHGIGAKKEHTQRKGLTDEAILKLLNASYPASRYNVMFHDLVRLALLTGIRVDALCSLKHSDVEKRKDGYWLSIEFDKTPSGTRTVPLHTAGAAVMARRIKGKGEFLFPDLKPDKWGDRSGNFTKAYTRFRRRAGVSEKGQVFHTFRNTFLECIEAQGVPESTAKLLVGHKRASLTYGHYSKGERIELRRFIQKLNYGRAVMAAISRPLKLLQKNRSTPPAPSPCQRFQHPNKKHPPNQRHQ